MISVPENIRKFVYIMFTRWVCRKFVRH